MPIVHDNQRLLFLILGFHDVYFPDNIICHQAVSLIVIIILVISLFNLFFVNGIFRLKINV